MIVDEDLLTLNNLLENYNFKGYHLDNYESISFIIKECFGHMVLK